MVLRLPHTPSRAAKAPIVLHVCADRRRFSATAEYRGTLRRNGLVGVVAFVNMTTVSNRQSGETLFRSVAPGAGVGLRLLVDKLSRTRVSLDVGFGRQGSRGIYLAVQEAF